MWIYHLCEEVKVVILEEDLPLAAVEPVNPEPDQQQLGVRLAGHHPATVLMLIGGNNGDGRTSAARNLEPSILITEPG